MDPALAPVSLSEIIDDYMLWFVAWHRLATATGDARAVLLPEIQPPASFAAWRQHIFAELAEDQPAVEKLAGLHDQIHTLIRMVLMKTPADQPIDRADDESIVAKYRDLIRGLRRFEQAFAEAASGLDALTGLRSRAGIAQDIDRELKRFIRTGSPFCVAIMDIDHFKKVNDTYGHEAGDRVLASVADHVSRGLRAHDDAFRFGGEEFVLSLKEADLKIGLQVLERLRAGLAAKPVGLANGTSIPVTASFGLAVCTPAVGSAELLRLADAALYRAKHEGRNRIVTADAPLVLESKS